MNPYLKGVFKKSIFKSDKGYYVGLFRVKDTNHDDFKPFLNKTITFTGTFPDLHPDDTYLFYGSMVKHPKFGYQYNVTEFERVKPEDKNGIIEFLSSDLFPGVGPKMAAKVVEALGLNAVNIILEDATVLKNIKGLSAKKAKTIECNIRNYENSHTTIVYLTELGFSISDAMLIFKRYNEHVKTVIERNIYQIVTDIEEIHFTKVDSIALNQGMKMDDANRIKSVIIYVMYDLCFQFGDTALEYLKIIKQVEKYIGASLNTDFFDQVFYELVNEKKIMIYDNMYFLKELYDAESFIAKTVIDLSSREKEVIPKLDTYLASHEESIGITYSDKQREAIIKALENNILIITGGPGTGKTTIIKGITELFATVRKLNLI